MLRLKNITAGYGKLEVLKGLDIQVQKGEIVALLGWNGAGKSTCLKTIAGIVKPTNGDIWLSGEKISTLAPTELRMKGIVFAMQNHRCFKSMTVSENLRIAATSVPLKDINARISKIWQDYPDLYRRKSHKAGTLSDGMQQYLSLAMTMIIPFQVLLLDEPSHGLDKKSMAQFGMIFSELAASGSCILMAEQNMDFVEAIASRRCWLEEGKARSGN